MDVPRRRVAAPPRLRRGNSVKTGARLRYDDALCGRALDIVLDAYGSELGNAAVKWLPFGGLYIAGGIALKNVDRLRAPETSFMRARRGGAVFGDAAATSRC